MDGDDSRLVFDFESTLDAAGAGSASGSASDALAPAAVGPHRGQGRGSGNVRQTVCRHWLRGLCMMGDSCAYLHQYDQDRLPVCYFYRMYGCCREQDCVFKHIAEEVKECSMYNMGFCPNGPHCQYRHVKKPGPPPPVEEVIKKLRQMDSLNYGSPSGIYQPRDSNNNQQEKPHVQHGSVLKNQKLSANATPVVQQPIAHHVQTANQQHVPPPHIQQQQQQNAHVQGVPNDSSGQATITASPPPQGQSRTRLSRVVQRLFINLLATLVVGFGDMLKEVQYAQNFSPVVMDALFADEAHGVGADEASCYEKRRESKLRMRTVAELPKEAEHDSFFVHGDGFGFAATDLLAISQQDLGEALCPIGV